jgi:hypothetical protein
MWDKIRDAIINVFHKTSKLVEVQERASYVFEDLVTGYVYICYTGEDSIALSDAKWKIKRIKVTTTTGISTVTEIKWAESMAYDKKASIPTSYNYVYLKS